jgi:hypothetical protein
MLIEKTFTKNDIIAIRLLSGEEIIAKCVDADEKFLTISKPCIMALMNVPNNPGQGYVTLMPFMLGVEDEAKFKLDHSKYLVAVKARKDAVAQYTKSTTGLEIPGGSLTL